MLYTVQPGLYLFIRYIIILFIKDRGLVLSGGSESVKNNCLIIIPKKK